MCNKTKPNQEGQDKEENIAMTVIYYKKPYDVARHCRIIECIKM